MEEGLSPERGKSNLLIINLFICVGIHMIQLVVKTINGQRFAESYINNMRVNLIGNFLDFFTSKVAIFSLGLVILIEILGKLLTFKKSEEMYLYSLSYHVVLFYLTTIPYRGYPLR